MHTTTCSIWWPNIDRTIVDSHHRIVDPEGDNTILCILHSISETFLCTNNVTMSNCTSIYHINHVTIECSWTIYSFTIWMMLWNTTLWTTHGRKERGREMAVKQTRDNDLQTFGSWTTGHCQQPLIHSPLKYQCGCAPSRASCETLTRSTD